MSRACRFDDWRFTFPAPCAPRVMIGAYVRRIAKLNVGAGFLRQRPDFRIFFLQPLLDEGFIALPGAMKRLLAGHTKLREKTPNQMRFPFSLMTFTSPLPVTTRSTCSPQRVSAAHISSANECR